jgi:hypothetical protein
MSSAKTCIEWYGRPGSQFGFGGQLVSFKPGSVTLQPSLVTDAELVAASVQFEAAAAAVCAMHRPRGHKPFSEEPPTKLHLGWVGSSAGRQGGAARLLRGQGRRGGGGRGPRGGGGAESFGGVNAESELGECEMRRARWVMLRARWGDAKSSLGDAKSSLGDAESSLGDAESSLGDAKSSRGDV